MLIATKDGRKVDVAKSAGRMIVLMWRSGLQIHYYKRGSGALPGTYTTAPFGPLTGHIYDWGHSSPVHFTSRQVLKAAAAGLVHWSEVDGTVSLTTLARDVAEGCCGWWEPEIDRHFAGRGIDWRLLR